MSANATETQSLTKACAMLFEFIGTEYTVVGMELFDGNTNICCFGFRKHLTPNRVASGGGQLVVDVNEGAAVVDVDGATCISVARRAVP